MNNDDIYWPAPADDDDIDWPAPADDDISWPAPADDDDIDILDQPVGTSGTLDCGCDIMMVITTGNHLKDCETRR